MQAKPLSKKGDTVSKKKAGLGKNKPENGA